LPKEEKFGVTEMHMKTDRAANALQTRAAEALKTLLGQVSGVKVKEMSRKSLPHGRDAGILVHLEVFGHSHTLACEVNAHGSPTLLGAALEDLHNFTAQLASDATPVLIAPYLSPGAQALCKQSQAGFLDLEGNARLSVGELFICMRSIPRHEAMNASAAPPKPHARVLARSSDRSRIWKLAHDSAGAAVPA
jgi:hypothetical protein